MKIFPSLLLLAFAISFCGCGGGSTAEPLSDEELTKQMVKDQQEAVRIQAQPVVPSN